MGDYYKMAEKSAVNLCGKYTLFFSTFLLFLLTGAAVGVSAYAITLRERHIESFFEFISDWPCDICLLSSYMCLMSLAGWIGALRENTCCLLIFKVMMVLLIFIEMAIIILVFLLVYEPVVQNYVYDEDTYQRAIVRYRDPAYESLQELIDNAQRDWECCGVSNDEDGYKDWTVNEYFNCTPGIEIQFEFCSVPHTCCKVNDGDIVNILCGQGMADPDLDAATRSANIHTKGCFLAFRERLQKNILWVGIVAICVIIPELFLLKLSSDLRHGIAIQLARQLRTQQYVDRVIGAR